MRQTVSGIRPVCYVRANFQLMPPKPLFRRKLKRWICFELIGSPGPGVKKIPTPALGIDEHIRRPLTIGVAVKPCVAQSKLKQCARVETIKVRDACRDTF